MKLAAIFATLTLASCSQFEGNGITLSVEYEDAKSGLKAQIETAK